MPKAFKPTVSIADISTLPPVIDVSDASSLLGVREKFMRAHAAEFGGVKVAGTWKFGTAKLLRSFGAEV